MRMVKNPLLFFVISLGFAVLSAESAQGARGAYALYQFNGSFDSKCVPRVSNPDAVLSQNGISTRGGATAAERQALANGIAKIQQLRGGQPLPGSWRTPYNFITTSNARGRYTWNQGAAAINVRRPAGSNNGQNETRLIHELGHKIGNAGNYGDYNRAVGRRCGISPYCTAHANKRNEEFAEAFAAFVTRPSHLRTVCPEAYAYFSQKLFPGSDAVASCGDSPDTQLQQRWASTPERERQVYTRAATVVKDYYCESLLCFFFGIGRKYYTEGDRPRDTAPAASSSQGER